MLSNYLEDARSQLRQIKAILAISNRDKSFEIPYGHEEIWPEVDAVDIGYWKAYEHSAVLVRGYATFERFVLYAVEEWIAWSQSHHPNLLLGSEKARDAYERGLAEILRRKAEPRFADLDRGKLAVGHAAFFGGKLPENIALPVAPFFAALPNLKLSKIGELFSSVEMAGLLVWINSSVRLRQFCEDEGFNCEEELGQIVDWRNEAAHGNDVPADILGDTELISRLNFLIILAETIFDFVIVSVCRADLGAEFETGLIGTVSHVWTRRGAFELTMASCVICKGTQVLMLSQGAILASSILSLQLEGKAAVGLEVAIGTPVGVTMGLLPADNMRMIAISSVKGLNILLGGEVRT